MLERVKKQRQEQAQQSRRKLMEAALSLFSRNGYAGTNVRSINRSIGAADGLLYHYFPGGKKELLAEIVREQLESIEQRARQWSLEQTDLPLEESVDGVFTAAAEIFEENITLFRLLMREEAARSTLEFEQVYRTLLEKQRWLAVMLEMRVARGDLPPIDCVCAADTLFSLMVNYFLGRLMGLAGDKFYTEEHTRRMLRYQCSLWLQAKCGPTAAESGGGDA